MAKRWLKKLLVPAFSAACAFAIQGDNANYLGDLYPWGERARVEEAWLNAKECTWDEIDAGECMGKKPDSGRGEAALALRTQPFISIVKNFKQGSIDVIERLVVNTSDMPYASLISREAGEKDLAGLCHSAKLEEAWIYTGNKWIEIGKAETYSSVIFDYDALSLASGEISLYHFHPIDLEDKKDDSQYPSPGDFMQFAKALKMMGSKYPWLKPDFRVAVSSGVYTIKFSDNALNDAPALDKAVEKMGNELVLFAAGSDYSQANRENFAKNNRIVAEALSNEFVKIEFREIDKY